MKDYGRLKLLRSMYGSQQICHIVTLETDRHIFAKQQSVSCSHPVKVHYLFLPLLKLC